MWRFPPTASEVTASELSETRPPDGSQNFLRLLGRSPAALKAFLLAQAALACGALTERQREEIALAVAEINGSKYCLALHEQKGRQAGMTPTEIRRSEEAAADNPQAQAMLHFVQAAVLQRGEVSNEDFAVLRRAGFSDEQVIEVLANVVLNIFSNYFNLIAQTELETFRPQADQSVCFPGTAPGGTDRNTMVNPR